MECLTLKIYKIFILHDMVVKTPMVRNVEALDGDGNRQIQEQIRREYPTLKQLLLSQGEYGSQKEVQTTTASNLATTMSDRSHNTVGREKEVQESRKQIGRQVAPCGLYFQNYRRRCSKKAPFGQMSTRHRGANYVSVMTDLKIYRGEMKFSIPGD